jgi:hypothetical protein
VSSAKDGNSILASNNGQGRPRTSRIVVASIAAIAGVGALIVMRRARSAFSRRKPRQVVADATEAGVPLQQITRYRAADGTHAIRGTLLAEFAAGERTATLHVAFCPPFERLPTVEAEALNGCFADVKVAQLLHNGIQIDVRLPEAADEHTTVTVELMACE